jgi:nucleoside-diphosphate-sugar epimerase
MRTALVTGAAGFIGSHLVEGLLARDYRVRGFDNLSTGSRDTLAGVWERERVAFTEGDVRDQQAVDAAVEGVDTVFHLAADTSVPGSFDHPARTTAINCTGTANVFGAAREAAVESVVLASSAAVYGSDVSVPVSEDTPPAPESPYALSKHYGEQLASQLADAGGFDATAVRYFNVFGPRQDPSGSYAAVIPAFVDRLLAGDPPVIFGDGEKTRDFVYVTDVVDATIAAAEHECNTVVNVGSGQRVTVTELAETLADLVDSDLDPVYDPPREGDIRHSGADISRAREQLAFEPSVAFAEGLERTVESFRE